MLNASHAYPAMSARLVVDFLLLEARQITTGNTPPLQIIPDVTLTTTVRDPITLDKVVVAARADWIAGHAVGADTSATFVALHTQSPALFSGLHVQLVTALGKPPPLLPSPISIAHPLTGAAIARHRRVQQRMKECVVQGFITDGVLFRFVQIDAVGKVRTLSGVCVC